MSSNFNELIKRRFISAGIPLSLKFGKLSSKKYLFVGGEYEAAFHYKHKLFYNRSKVVKKSEWMSKRIPLFYPSVFCGINLAENFRISFKYYLSAFFNEDFQGLDFGEDVDYSEFSKSNFFSINISFPTVFKIKTEKDINQSASQYALNK